MKNTHLIPDWEEPKAIALVWPEHLGAGRGKKLKGFYKDFILLLSKNVPINVLFSTANKKFDPPAFLNNIKNVNILPFDEIGDIWLRDYGPFPVKYANSIGAVSAKYHPKYHSTDAAKRDGAIDNEVGANLSKKLYNRESKFLKVGSQDIILDGGNLIHNGEGTAIITNRIISDNEHFFIDEIKEALKQQVGITDLHLIPTEPGDDTGHADGLVRFINSKTLIVTKYLYKWERDKGYIKKSEFNESKALVNSLASYFKSKGFKVGRMPCGVPLDSKKFESAVGNYTNFLRVGDLFFLPMYGNKEQDENAKNALIKIGVNENDIIQEVDCTELAKEGGVLNCITSQVY